MGSIEVGIVLLFFLTVAVIVCTVVLFPSLKDLIKELRRK